MPSKNYLQIIDRACKVGGWRQSKTSGGHIKLTHPNATGPIFAPKTPSDHRAGLNLQAEMRRKLAPDAAEPAPIAEPAPAPPEPAPVALEELPAAGLTDTSRHERHLRQVAQQSEAHLAEALQAARAKIGELERELKPLRELRNLIRMLSTKDYAEPAPSPAPPPMPPPVPPPAPPPMRTKLTQDNAGELIKARRQVTGESQAEAAKSLGTSNASISTWERGQCRPNSNALPAIEAYLYPPERKN